MPDSRRVAIVLFNLGGPDSLSAVQPFLFNLFNDRNIINLPQPFRWLLAKLISTRRAPIATHVYEQMGGRSPILPNTEAQATALEAQLSGSDKVRCFIAMRYWRPFTEDAAKTVKDWGPDEIILLPLYPQFSTTTTASSYRVWQDAAQTIGLSARQRLVCCYPDEPGFIAALADITATAIATARKQVPDQAPAIIFSAHGLPQKIVDAGDPYVTHVEATVASVAASLGLDRSAYQIAYQSRVGPLKWVGPATDETILAAAKANRPIVIVPVAFVSEHSETLVELDIEYGHLAQENGAAAYVRAPTVSTHPSFIKGLADLARAALAEDGPVLHDAGKTKGSCLR
ncbi:ferrochelatase [Dongia sp.]|uniref:ferrochelatase n=1 Tax=Dongia sp. TaxID=1977262 RepID=UPI0035B4E5D0